MAEKVNLNVIADNLITIYPLLYKNIAKPMRSKSHITPGGMFVLGSIKRHGPLSMSDIGKYLTMPKPHVTVLVDKLIEDELVERNSDPNDRRIINISITEKGLADLAEIKLAISESLKCKLSLLGDEELEKLSDASNHVKEILVSLLSKE